jgi:hypothetical protein
MKSIYRLFKTGGRIALASLLLLLGMLASNVRSQGCPGTIPPVGIAWSPDPSSPKTYTISSTCKVTVYFCTRVVGGYTEYFITKIETDPTQNCAGDDWSWIIYVVNTSLLCCNPDRPCIMSTATPACGYPPYPTTETYYAAQCWKYNPADPIVGSQPSVTYCEGSAYCKRVYSLCCDHLGHLSANLISTSSIPSGYNYLCETPGTVWEPNTCYYVDNCGTP